MSPKERTVAPREQDEAPKQKTWRRAVLTAALLGAALSLGLGVKWILFVNSAEGKQHVETIRGIASSSRASSRPQADLEAEVADWDNKGRACYGLLVSAVLGLAGSYLSYRGQAKPAGVVLVVGGLLPLAFSLAAILATAPLLIAGALNFVPQTPEVEPEPVKRKRSMGPYR